MMIYQTVTITMICRMPTKIQSQWNRYGKNMPQSFHTTSGSQIRLPKSDLPDMYVDRCAHLTEHMVKLLVTSADR